MRKPLSRPWSEDDIARLKQLAADGASATRCTAVLHRPTSSILLKARKLGLPSLGVRAAKARHKAKEAAALSKLPPSLRRDDGNRF